jgi:succinate dehydrogenase hydrophobic anchor subunit
MTSYQRAKRFWFWRGSAVALLFFTTWILASSYCSQLTQ